MSTAAPPTLPPGGPGTAGAIGGLALTDALRGILRAIHDRPDDDTPRGAFADELEAVAGTEPCRTCDGRGAPPVRPGAGLPPIRQRVGPDGRVERYAELAPFDYKAVKPCEQCRGRGWVPDVYGAWAEFIRVQLELARLPEPELKTIGPLPGLADAADRREGRCLACAKSLPRPCRYHALEDRERELLCHQVGGLGLPPGIGSVQVTWRRGFVEACEVSHRAWEVGGDALRAVHPVRRVRLTTWPGRESVEFGVVWWRLPEQWHAGKRGSGLLVPIARRAAEVKAGAERTWKGVVFGLPPR